jgi:dipeptidyl-peptidase-3
MHRLLQLQHHTTYPNILESSSGERYLQAHHKTTGPRSEGSIMDAKTKQQYLADSPPTVVRLEIKTHFDALRDEKLKRYAHFMSRSVYPLYRILGD